MKIILVFIFVFVIIGMSTPNVFGHILEPQVLYQDEFIKILDGGIGYSNLGLTDSGAGAGFGTTWTDSVYFVQIVNVSDSPIFHILTELNTYDHNEKLLDSEDIFLTTKWDALLPNESAFAWAWMEFRGWSCFEFSIKDYQIATDISELKNKHGLFTHNLEILHLTDNGKGMFTGKVKNNGETKISDVIVSLIKFDSDGNIISILVDDVGNVSPNKSKSFEIAAYLKGSVDKSERGEVEHREPHHVDVFAYGGTVRPAYELERGWGYYTDVSSSNYFNSGDYQMIGNKNLAPLGSCTENKLSVPTWIKNNAGWWAEGQIDDIAFVQGIQFMIKEKIMNIPHISESAASQELPESKEASSVPTWIKNNAGWWAEGQIDDNSFVKGIEYMVKVGIIEVN
tara:strand:- start:83 stop:1273 length:1191 start_codon:yes stop_codon:yes gene_type:complete